MGLSLSERLKAATDELQALEQLVVSGDSSPRVLSEFRGAIDSIRQTAWAVQQWAELKTQNRDPYTVLGLLSANCEGFNHRSGVSGNGLGNQGVARPLSGHRRPARTPGAIIQEKLTLSAERSMQEQGILPSYGEPLTS